MQSTASPADKAFLSSFERFAIAPKDFSHASHLRLAYIYLTELEVDEACATIRQGLRDYLIFHGVGESKYHETMTKAWVLAVRHFMNRKPARSSDEFLAQSAVLLDSSVMLTHYSRERLFSDQARAAFVEPDLDPIPH